MKKEDVKHFFVKRFGSQNTEIDDDALNLMVEFTAGSPLMMQNMGDCIFWMNNSDIISKNVVLDSIKQAKKEIELRYLHESLDEFNITEDDLNILKILGKDFINRAYDEYSFTIKDIADHPSKFDEEVQSNFISKALNCGIIEVKSENEKSYSFTNDLYPLYFAI